MLKRMMLTVLAVMLVLAIAACGSDGGNGNSSGGGPSSAGSGGSGSSGGSGGQAAKKVVLEYWHTYSDAEEKVLLEEIKPLFETEHPNIELNITRMPYEGLKQQVIAGVAGGAAPDLMRMDIIWVPEFAKLGALQKVNELDGFEELKAQLFEGPMSTNYYNGDYYGLPLNTNTKVAIYNKKVLESVGLSNPPTTMQELADVSRQLVKDGKLPGIGISGVHAWALLPYFWSLGGKLTNDDFSQVEGYLNSPESIQAVETIAAWHEEGLIIPAVLGGEPSTWDGMKKHEYLMIDDGPWFYSILMGEASEEFDVLRDTVRGLIPAGPAGSHSVIGGENLVIFTGSKHTEEAWTFARWMLGEEPQKIMSKVGMIPTNIKAANEPTFLEVPYMKEYVEQLETALPRTPNPQWGEMEGIFNLAVEKVLRGESDVTTALNQATQQIEAILKE